MNLDKNFDKILAISFILMIIATTAVIIFAIIPGSKYSQEWTTVTTNNVTPASEYASENQWYNKTLQSGVYHVD